MLIASVATVLALAAIIWFATRPSYKVLFYNLPEAETARVMEQLAALGIPHELGAGGTTIRIPENMIHTTRLEMAKAGMPKTTEGQGFELFDTQSLMGLTDFMQRMNYQRALQGELQRTIESIQAVEKARVHLVLPKESNFTAIRGDEQSSASVQLTLNQQLTASQVAGIVHLVAGSVKNLDETKVTVIDHKGKILAGGEEDDLGGAMASDKALKLKRHYEKEKTDKIKTMLDRLLGPDTSIVRVDVELDLEKRQRQEEIYDPEGAVPLSTQNVEENSNGVFGTGGVPGVIPNDPNQTATTGASGSSQTRSVNKETINYQNSKTVRTIQEGVGTIKKLSVAVLVDGTYETPAADKDGNVGEPVYKPRTQEEIDMLKRVVEKTVGFDTDRGDAIEVTSTAFKPLPPPKEQENPWLSREFQLEMAKYAALALLVFLLVFFVLRPLVKKLLLPEEVEDDKLPGAVAELERQLMAEGVGATPSDQPGKLMVPDRTLQLAQQMIGEHLEEAREVLRSWMQQDTYS
ncbi:putative flagellar M-ring protein FliF [Magnetofaba australis IT-1]|uniref:Flagellar M-ring protein n=1 Tax=Magnetofaba australis IT-1 TaxID=1434232 RepID=A0A1Y2K1F5_9PROT|nr:putative flagellar M-ring protein FliF [Magnetofaba australis IT-1]